jgi:hypothetical protein
MEVVTNDETSSHVHSSLLIPTIHMALSACKIYHTKKRATSTFPTDPWYDEECKETKRSLKEINLGK